MNTFLIVYENANFTSTGMNATLEEAKTYYVGNYFTFGTCEENKEQVKAVAVFEYDAWKEEVLNFNMQNDNITLNFNDETKEMMFKIPYNDFITVTYEQVKNAMYSNGIEKLVIENAPSVQIYKLNERLTNYKTYPVAVIKKGMTMYLLCKNQKFKDEKEIFTWSYDTLGHEKALRFDYVNYINNDYEILKVYDQESLNELNLFELSRV